jgi:hypothetical protein
LFNGRNLDGWKQMGGKAKYEVVNGELVGTTVANTPNSFLTTEVLYGDFILELELKVDEKLNSGIQIRSESKHDYNKGVVHGYQVEVDPSARAWSAGLYDESRRGWLYPLELNPSAKGAFRHNEWNLYRVEAIGSTIRTWLNGVPAAQVVDDMTLRGFIALQVHGVAPENVGLQVRWRNIRIQTQQLRPSRRDDLFVLNLLPNQLNAQERSQGWRLLNSNEATVSEGKGQVVTLPSRTKEIQFAFKTSQGAMCRVMTTVQNSTQSGTSIYAVSDPINRAAMEQNAALLGTLATINEDRAVRPVGDWNHARVVFTPDAKGGAVVQHWLNGFKMLEYPTSAVTIDSIPRRGIQASCQSGTMTLRSVKGR